MATSRYYSHRVHIVRDNSKSTCEHSRPIPNFNIFLNYMTVKSNPIDIFRKRLVRNFIGLVELFESSGRLSIPAGTKWISEVTGALQRANLHHILYNQEATLRPGT